MSGVDYWIIGLVDWCTLMNPDVDERLKRRFGANCVVPLD